MIPEGSQPLRSLRDRSPGLTLTGGGDRCAILPPATSLPFLRNGGRFRTVPHMLQGTAEISLNSISPKTPHFPSECGENLRPYGTGVSCTWERGKNFLATTAGFLPSLQA